VPASGRAGERAFPAPGLVAVVTDSTASLPADDPASTADGVIVVPQRLLAGDLVSDDGAPGAADIEAAAARGVRLTTARPAPAQFAEAYRRAAGAGAAAVVSVHVSGMLSGTVSSAALAAAAAPIPVRVIDARTIGTGLGLVVLAAVAAAGAGEGLDAVASAANAYASQVGTFFAVDRPDALLAGGRAASGDADVQRAEQGEAAPRLVSRTVLRLDSGRISAVDRVRTWSGAEALLARCAAEQAAGLPAGTPAEVVVEHVAAAGRADDLADRLRAGLPQARRVSVVAASTAIGVHTGPIAVGVSVAPSPAVG
jgi:DegV family protein with EDD domain